MSIANALALSANSTRAKVLRNVKPNDWKWALPFMRAGYAGRALVYVTVAAVSLYSIAKGGQAEGASAVFESLPGEGWPVLALIALGMFAYTIWRFIDCFADLEAYGTDAKGLIARAGMLTTGVIHAAIGVFALSSMGFVLRGSGGGDANGVVAQIMSMQGGVWLVGGAGALTVGAGIYYLYKGMAEKYRNMLKANSFTNSWNWLLKTGVLAQGIAVGIVGGLILYAAVSVDPEEAGGIGAAFDWLRGQPFGQYLIIALCAGFLAFALFCFVNALYRIVPKAYEGNTPSLAASARSKQRNGAPNPT